MMVNMVDKLIKGGDHDPTTLTKTIPHASGTGTVSYVMKQVYTRKPHFTANNFFSSEKLIEWLGEKGYGMTATSARNRIPTEITPYTHYQQVADTSHMRCKAMRFDNPIVAIETVDEFFDILWYK
jgi:hypothetical protein